MTELERIVDELRRAHDGDPWHGLPLTKVLAGLSARAAATRPISTANSIWEILLHVCAWTGEVRRRLQGRPPGEPPEGDWPVVQEVSDEAWEQAKVDLARAHEALIQELGSTRGERLWEIVGPPARDRALGTGTTFYVMLHGLVQHGVYHTAQIATIRRVLEEGAPSAQRART